MIFLNFWRHSFSFCYLGNVHTDVYLLLFCILQGWLIRKNKHKIIWVCHNFLRIIIWSASKSTKFEPTLVRDEQRWHVASPDFSRWWPSAWIHPDWPLQYEMFPSLSRRVYPESNRRQHHLLINKVYMLLFYKSKIKFLIYQSLIRSKNSKSNKGTDFFWNF